MLFLDHSLPEPDANLALDDSLLDAAESVGSVEFLRVWNSPCYVVVLGKNCRLESDVIVDRCESDGVAILRRRSGGGSVLLGPGCLNFSLVLRLDRAPELQFVRDSFQYVLDRVLDAVRPFAPEAEFAGESDLAVNGLKFCGNAQRRRATHFLHHGSILLDFDLVAISRYLREPTRRPAYRGARDHATFLTNLRADAASLCEKLREVWQAEPISAAALAALLKTSDLGEEGLVRRVLAHRGDE